MQKMQKVFASVKTRHLYSRSKDKSFKVDILNGTMRGFKLMLIRAFERGAPFREMPHPAVLPNQ
jgi:hypothetical protein